MTKPLVLTIAMLVSPSIAMAQGIGLYVGSDCSGPVSVTNACTTNTGTAFTLFGTCIVPPSGLPSFSGANAQLDVQTALATIPDWWRMDACRSNAALSLRADSTIAGAVCSHSLWDGAATVINAWSTQLIPGRANRVQLILAAALLPDEVHNLIGDGTTELAVFSLTMLNTKSVGTGACAGCTQGACIVLNKIRLVSDSYAVPVLELTTPIPGRNYVTYNGGSPDCPASTPTRNSTWGAIKAIYR